MKSYFILMGVAGLAALAVGCNSEAQKDALKAVVSADKAAPADSLRHAHHAGHHPGGVMDPAAHKAGQSANEHMHARPFEELVAAFDDPARAEWQQPEKVLRLLGPLKGKTVMDIGAGTGYFSFPLAKAGARVISADVDDRFLKLIEARRAAQKLTAAQLSTRKLPFDSPQLAPAEADVVLLVDVYHHIENRAAYFRQVRAGLKPGGRLVIVDFKKHDIPVGPPASMKLTPMEIEPELKAAGFERQEVDHDALPYQYIITAYR